MKLSALAISLALTCGAVCAKPFVWENATVYFVLTDRFYNANPANDHAYGPTATGRATSPASTPTSAPRPTCASWWTPPTPTASACCSTW